MMSDARQQGRAYDTPCPVCAARDVHFFCQLEDKTYWACPNCAARFLDPKDFPTHSDECAHYLQHENDPDDPAYRAFLARLADPLLQRIAPGQHILEFGCGPGPALARMLREAGHRVTLYDPFFANDASVLDAQYDVITCTETVEHFHNPHQEFSRFDTMLRPGGWLAIMTCFQTDDEKFANWHYRKDPTHVVFYRETTFRTLARALGWTCEIPRKDVVFMQKPAA